MSFTIELFTEDRIEDVIAYERELREQEKDTYFWDIDEQYITNVKIVLRTADLRRMQSHC